MEEPPPSYDYTPCIYPHDIVNASSFQIKLSLFVQLIEQTMSEKYQVFTVKFSNSVKIQLMNDKGHYYKIIITLRENSTGGYTYRYWKFDTIELDALLLTETKLEEFLDILKNTADSYIGKKKICVLL